MMNTVANNIQLCIASQSRKMNSLAFILECLFCFCIAYTFIRQESADPEVASPKRISVASLPIVRIGTVCNFGVTTCNLTKRCILSSKKRRKS